MIYTVSSNFRSRLAFEGVCVFKIWVQECPMLFSAGNAITLGIVLVFFFVYHKLTSNNRSLEKVKKFSEKLQIELGDYVSSRADELKHYGIELDVHQKAARLALEKLKEAEAAVAEKAESIGEIAERFKQYDEVLSGLMKMTERVDQNLARIHDDEAFAESVNKKLDLAKKSLSALEREMPLLREAFAQDAKKTVDAFRDDILAELHDELASTSQELSAVKKEAMEAYSKAVSARALVDAELEKALAVARERASSIEDEAFSMLTANLNSRLEELRNSVEGRMEELARGVASEAKSLRESVANFKLKWEQESAALLEDFAHKAEAVQASFEEKSAATLSALNEKILKAHSLSAAISNEAVSAAEVFESKSKASEARLEENLKKLESLQDALVASMKETENRVEEDFASFGQAFEEHRARFEADVLKETTSITKEIESLQNQIVALKEQAYMNARGKLEGFEDAMLADLENRKAQTYQKLDAWLTEMGKTLSSVQEEAKAQRLAEEGRYAEEFRAHLVKVRDDMYAQLEKMRENLLAVKESIQEENRAEQA